MIVGVPTEIKPDERRVALTPAGAAALRNHDHRVLVQRGAGVGSGFSDRDYRAAGAQIVRSAAAVWKRARMVLKVKEPQHSEFRFLRPRPHPLHLSPSGRRAGACARAAAPRHGGARLRDGATGRSEPAAARADERGRRTARGTGRRMVPGGAKRRTRRAAERSVGRAAGPRCGARRRNRGRQRVRASRPESAPR